jgi:UDP-GlcNAc:undecaprenyl-phosphate GlcNAc-1-phosphate transferase
LVALGAALVLTPVNIFLSKRFGLIDRPRADRWSQREVAKLGGVAIFAAFLLSALLFAPRTGALLGVLVGSGLIFLLGFWDDLRPLKPAQKLLGQILIACLAVGLGVRASFGGELAAYSSLLSFLGVPLSVFWIVGITNAFNLLDNMDGLSSGVAAIAASFVTTLAVIEGDLLTAALGMSVAGAALGFLVYNFNPAKVFMGDTGSLTLGFLLAAVTLVGSWRDASHLSLVLLAPVLLLGVPIFDTTLVTVLRKLHGRPASQGGRDHSSHRLVALGLSERRAVLVLYALCVSLGGVALVGAIFDRYTTAVVAAVAVLLLLIFGVFLGDVKVYREVPAGPGDGKERLALVNTLLLHKRRILEVFCDFLAAFVAYVLAYLLRFEGLISVDNARLILSSLPLVLAAKLVAFLGLGVYSGAWKYAGLDDAVRIVRAAIVGEVGAVLLLVGLSRFEGYSRALFVVDAALFSLMALGLRFLWRLLRERVFPFPTQGRRVAIVGKNGAAAGLLDAILRDRSLGLRPVALVDDDPQLAGRRLRGVPVLSAGTLLPEEMKRYQVEEILASPVTRDSFVGLQRLGTSLGVPVRVVSSLRGSFAPVSPELLARLERALTANPPDVEAARACLDEMKQLGTSAEALPSPADEAPPVSTVLGEPAPDAPASSGASPAAKVVS